MINNAGKDNVKKQRPGLGSTATLVLVAGLFLIIIIPLLLINSQQPSRQAELQKQLALLQKVPSSPSILKQNAEEQVRQAEKDLAETMAVFPRPDQSPDLLTRLVELAAAHGISIIRTEVRTDPVQLSFGTKDKVTYAAISYSLGLRGQVSKFQNFIISLDKFPGCRVRDLTFTAAEKKGDEDVGTMIIDFLALSK